MYNLKFLLFALSFFCILVAPCRAKEDNQVERIWDFGIGIGYGQSTNPFIGAGNVPVYLTLDFSIYGERLFFENGELGFTLIDQSNFGINLISTYNSERIYYSYFNDLGIKFINNGGLGNVSVSSSTPIIEINSGTTITPTPLSPPFLPSLEPPLSLLLPLGTSTFLLDIPDRDLAINLGAELIYDNKIGNFSIQFAKDVSGAHSGEDAIFNFTKGWSKGKWGYSFNLGLHWKSKKLVDYYYGLDFKLDQFIGLKYEGKSSIDRFLEFQLGYRINNNLSFVTSYKYNRFGKSISDSPLIETNHKQTIFTGLFFKF